MSNRDMSKEKKRLCIILTSALSMNLLRKQWAHWMKHGWEVHCIAGPGDEAHNRVRAMGVKTFVVPIERNPSPIKDILTLIQLWWLLLWHRYDILHLSTPKASFFGALAGRLSFHSHLYYLVRGRAYENMTGLKRKVMNICEWLTCHLATLVVPICRELGEILVTERLCPPGRIRIVGHGSSAGIDLEIFSRTETYEKFGKYTRQELGIKPGQLVIFNIGWFRRDKGIDEFD